MARFPTLEEYKDKPAKGVQKCDDLLKRDPTNVSILLTKLQLQVVLEDRVAAQQTLESLYTRPILDLNVLCTLEDAVVELQAFSFPTPLSTGPEVAKLWDTAFKASTTLKQKLDLQSLRCTRAVLDHRLIDAQQSLIQLKALAPKNRVFYMAHAALTQQLSQSTEDLQSRLALGLARKAVSEKFDDDKNLDCRVPGQIFAMQSVRADIEGIKDRRFADSKQVFDALRAPISREQAQEVGESPDPSTVPSKEWFNAEVSLLRSHLRPLLISEQGDVAKLTAFAASALRLFNTAVDSLTLKSYRPISEAVFLGVSALVKAWVVDEERQHLLQAAYLAHILLQVQPKVHEAKVILIYLYTRLGLGRLAYIQWDELAIREIQYDTFGHSFLSQISITHPHYLTDLDPLRIVTHALGTYRRLEDKLAETHASVLTHGQTGLIFDLYDVRQCLKLSTSRRILALEYRRLTRIFGKPPTQSNIHIHPRLTDAWLNSKDNRDFAAAFNHGFNIERALHQQDKPDDWILLSLAMDYVWCTVTGQTPAVKDADNLLTKLEAAGSDSHDYEQTTSNLIEVLLRELVTNHPHNESLTTNIGAALRSLYVDELTTESSVLPDQIREAHLDFDALHILTAFLKHVENKKLVSKQEITQMKESTSAKLKKLQAYCKARGNSSSTQAVRSFILDGDDDFVREMMTLNADDLTKYCGLVAEAGKDAWDGATDYKA